MTSNGIEPVAQTPHVGRVKDSTLLTLNACVALVVGALALCWPGTLLLEVKGAAAEPSALAMARTVGVLLVSLSLLSAMARTWTHGETKRGLFLAMATVHLGLLPLDPWAYATGAFTGLGSFVPNSVLHVGLGVAFVLAALRQGRAPAVVPSSR